MNIIGQGPLAAIGYIADKRDVRVVANDWYASSNGWTSGVLLIGSTMKHSNNLSTMIEIDHGIRVCIEHMIV